MTHQHSEVELQEIARQASVTAEELFAATQDPNSHAHGMKVGEVLEEVVAEEQSGKLQSMMFTLSAGVSGPNNPHLQAEVYQHLQNATEATTTLERAALEHAVNLVFAQQKVTMADMYEKRADEYDSVNQAFQDSAVNGQDHTQEAEEQAHAAQDAAAEAHEESVEQQKVELADKSNRNKTFVERLREQKEQAANVTELGA